jgi:hypothetical protein
VFRSGPLPGDVAGGLWLHSMPGRREPLEQAWAQLRIHGIKAIVLCLAEMVIGRRPITILANDSGSPNTKFPRVAVVLAGLSTTLT